jgi:hypothetical protein
VANDWRAVKDDVAFLRALTSEQNRPLAREGAVLVAVGAIFACVDVFYWLYFGHRVSATGIWQHVPWIAGSVLFFACFVVVTARIPRAPGAAARAISAASAGVGVALCGAVAALFAGAVSVQQPWLVTNVFPIVLLTLYGSVWMVAFAVKRRTWLAGVAAGCLAAAIGCGVVMGRPEEWLVLAAGMICLVAVPGGVLIHQSKG